jgi:hypothetical protein
VQDDLGLLKGRKLKKAGAYLKMQQAKGREPLRRSILQKRQGMSPMQ